MRHRLLIWVASVLAIVVMTVHRSAGDDGGGRDADKAPRCDDNEARVRSKFEKVVAEHNSCRRSADCTELRPGCPFGCYVGVRKDAAAVVEQAAQSLGRELGAACRCMYKCAAPHHLVCARQKCAIAVDW